MTWSNTTVLASSAATVARPSVLLARNLAHAASEGANRVTAEAEACGLAAPRVALRPRAVMARAVVLSLRAASAALRVGYAADSAGRGVAAACGDTQRRASAVKLGRQLDFKHSAVLYAQGMINPMGRDLASRLWSVSIPVWSRRTSDN